MTRGDGGQNVLGPEFDEELGLIRTHELLAARNLDGAQQFFTRARDFGYSKDHVDTLKIWGEQEILGDVVRVIRYFQPDVIVTPSHPRRQEPTAITRRRPCWRWPRSSCLAMQPLFQSSSKSYRRGSPSAS